LNNYNFSNNTCKLVRIKDIRYMKRIKTVRLTTQEVLFVLFPSDINGEDYKYDIEM
jgi:hypothetical protein